MKAFSNELIDTSLLPKMDEVSFLPLDPKYKVVVWVRSVVTFAIISGLFTLPWMYDHWVDPAAVYRKFLVSTAVLGWLIALYVLFVNIRGFHYKGYALRDYDVLFKSGFILRKKTAIPYNRVQHIVLHEGVLSRYLGLSSITFFTAGGGQGELRIPGIEREVASSIKEFVVGKIELNKLVNTGTSVGDSKANTVSDHSQLHHEL